METAEPMGLIQVTAGPMSAGKSEKLWGWMVPLTQHHRVAYVTHALDTRPEISRNPMINGFANLEDVKTKIKKFQTDHIGSLDLTNYDCIAIDEAQFFDQRLISDCLELRNQGKHVHSVGLLYTAKGERFGYLSDLLDAHADEKNYVKAKCAWCDPRQIKKTGIYTVLKNPDPEEKKEIENEMKKEGEQGEEKGEGKTKPFIKVGSEPYITLCAFHKRQYDRQYSKKSSFTRPMVSVDLTPPPSLTPSSSPMVLSTPEPTPRATPASSPNDLSVSDDSDSSASSSSESESDGSPIAKASSPKNSNKRKREEEVEQAPEAVKRTKILE